MNISVYDNQLYLGKHYACLAYDRTRKPLEEHKNEDEVIFTDGSIVNLTTGDLVDIFEEGLNPIIMVPLKTGFNDFDLGSPNLACKSKHFHSKTLNITYQGPVDIIPAEDGEDIVVEENLNCYAFKQGESVMVIPAPMKQISYFHEVRGDKITNTPKFDRKTKVFPTLRIRAPKNTTVQGLAKSFTFQELQTLEFGASNIQGGKANRVQSEVSHGNIKLESAGDLTLFIEGPVTIICTGFVNNMTVFGKGDARIEVKSVKSLAVDIAGSLTVKAGKIVTSNLVTSGDINFEANQHSGEFSAFSGQDILVRGGSYSLIAANASADILISVTSAPVIFAESSGRQTIKVSEETTSVKSRKAKNVKLNLHIADSINIYDAEKVEITAVRFSENPIVNGSAEAKINLK